MCIRDRYQRRVHGEVFSKGEELLKNAEDLRAGLMDTREKAFELIEAQRLIDPTVYDAIKALLVTAAATNEGKFPTSSLEFQEETPFLVINCGEKAHETYDLNEQIKTWLATISTAPQKIEEIITQAQELSEKAKEFPGKASDAAKNANVSTFKIPIAASNTAVNAQTLAKGIAKLPVLKDAIKSGIENLKITVQKLKEDRSKFDEWGKQAYDKKLRLPKEIVTEIWPKDRFKPQEEKQNQPKAK
eukprot:TRINITY_DN2108_c0_g2_i3.p1 TRINITY_DN2108_c0_g2~~TRINITY_DN2108_c0_g2_i3.p1  ORF type:complete len:245 (+),score=73.95 TRINITY_DN2108_c0_g2_i3:65-799(+)